MKLKVVYLKILEVMRNKVNIYFKVEQTNETED